MLNVISDMFVVGIPRIEMTEQQVMISAPSLTECDQIVWIKLQLRVKVEGFDVMNLQLFALVATGRTRRLAEPMLLCHVGPLGPSFTSVLPGYVRSMIYDLAYFEQPALVMAFLACELQEGKDGDEYSNHH